MRSKRVCIIVCTALVLLLASAAFGQEYRGRIQGTVTDSSDAAVPGAAVTLLNQDTGVSATRETNEVGLYLFDMVIPGKYTVTVESMGFSKFAQENINLVSRGDVTVNAALQVGNVTETVTVSATATTVQFNTGKLETTVDEVITRRLPQINRNPLMLAKIDPAVRQRDTAAEQEPYFTWSGNRQEVGGGREYTSDLQIDGSSINLGYKTSYMPAPDMVKEVTIQQNAMDAENGHSAGSAISLTMRSGTNELHGSGFYQGLYPWANAMENRVRQTVNTERNHMFGGSAGFPILKNKLFNFFSYEQHMRVRSGTIFSTLPTDLERSGDFSQSLNVAGGQRTVYDPFSTITSADGSTVTRDPFPGNIIPGSRQSQIGRNYLDRLWRPNRPGDGNYHINNFYAPLPQNYDYHNLSNRVDWNATDKIRVYGRYSKLWTPVTTSNPAGSDLFVSDRGSQRDATSISGDVVYVVSPSTVLNFNGTYHNFIDDAVPGSTADISAWEALWPGESWFQPMFNDPTFPVLIPRMTVRQQGNNIHMGPGGGFWQQHPNGDGFSAKLAQQRGKHYIKIGGDTRATRTTSILNLQYPGFGFEDNGTSSTYVSPDVRVDGDGYATFLLGGIQPTRQPANSWNGGSTSMPVSIVPSGRNRSFSAYINDDWKVTRNLTLNLGLRYEYEQAYRDPENRLTRPLDLASPIPEMNNAATAPVMPAILSNYYSGPTIFNGAFQFAESGNPGEWNQNPWDGWSPRVGMAYRINDKTSIRGGWGIYITPWTGTGHNIFDTYYNGFKSVTGALPAEQGVPVEHIDTAFSTRPLTPLTEKSLGRYTNLGDSLNFVTARDRPRGKSNRFNVSFERQLPGDMVVEFTYFLNFTGQQAVRWNVNQVDPRVALQFKGEVNQKVANPFYDYMTEEIMPGPLRYSKNVSLSSLMKAYPQYGDLNVNDEIDGGDMKYHSFQLRLEKRFSQGFSLMYGYNYNDQRNQLFYDNVDNFTQNWTWRDSNRERHRMTFAGTWDVPVGRGRSYLSNAHPVVDAVLGGWILSTLIQWNSGAYLRFGGMLWDGTDPVLDDPRPERWFNTDAFDKLPAYTRRENPMQFDGLTGPGRFWWDQSIMKDFHINERIKFVLRADIFNFPNTMTWADPNMSVTNSKFGTTDNVRNNNYGRRTQLGGRIEW